MNKELDINNYSEDIIMLEGYFFLKKNAIQNNSEIVQETFTDMYKHIAFN